MGEYEDSVREMIKKKFGSVPKMAEAIGIAPTTIYHALDRGLKNTRTETLSKIEGALFEGSRQSIDLTPDEQDLVDLYRATTEFGQNSIMTLARQLAEGSPRPKPGDFPSLYLSDSMSDDEIDERVATYKAELEEWTKARKEGGAE